MFSTTVEELSKILKLECTDDDPAHVGGYCISCNGLRDNGEDGDCSPKDGTICPLFIDPPQTSIARLVSEPFEVYEEVDDRITTRQQGNVPPNLIMPEFPLFPDIL